jgi:hypothetical protein
LANTAKITNATHTGDVSGADVLTLATVNSNLGTFNNVTINAKGLATAGTNIAYLTSFTEADPIFTAWDRSTGVIITSSQVSDFATSVTNNSAVLANTAKITNATHTGDVSGSDVLTLATVNTTTPGTYGTSTAVPTITVNGKGLVTASSSTSIAFPVTLAGTEALTNKTYNGYTLPAGNASVAGDILASTGADKTLAWVTPADLSVYGHFYELAVGAEATINANTDIPLSNNGPLQNITHTAGSPNVTINTTGVYKVEYGVVISTGIGAELAIFVNGVAAPNARIYFESAQCNYRGSAILSLTAGDVIKLRNNSSVTFYISISPYVGAEMTVTKVN